jgi:hypothetical protein
MSSSAVAVAEESSLKWTERWSFCGLVYSTRSDGSWYLGGEKLVNGVRLQISAIRNCEPML